MQKIIHTTVGRAGNTAVIFDLVSREKGGKVTDIRIEKVRVVRLKQ